VPDPTTAKELPRDMGRVQKVDVILVALTPSTSPCSAKHAKFRIRSNNGVKDHLWDLLIEKKDQGMWHRHHQK
jgi:hypothetical protein